MKKILLGFLFLLSTNIVLAETFTTQISAVSQTSANITVTGADIRKTAGFSVLSVRLIGIGPELILVEPGSTNCFSNVCNFPSTTKTITNLTCGTTYRGTVEVVSSLNSISRPVEIRTSSCQAGITVTFESITSSGENKALIKLKILDERRPVTGLDVKAEFTPIPTDPTSPTPGDTLVFSREIGLVSNASNERSVEKEVDISCTEGTTPKKYSVVIEATSRSTPPVVGRSQPMRFTTDLCPEEPPVGTGGNEDETEGDNTYVFLTPLPFNEGLNPQESVIIGATGEEGILGILQRIFTLMLVAAVVLAVVFLIIGGARYATGDTLGGVQGGRQIITNAVTGLLFALLAWLLLNVINPDLLRFTLVIPNVGSKLTPGTGNPDGGSGGDSPCAGLSDEECFEQIVADEDSKRGELRAAGIEVNKEPCSNYGESNCTHVGLLNESTLAKLIEVKNDCVSANRSCTVMVTGGTEYWLHSEGGSHRDFIAVDLRLTGADVFNQFIRSKQSVGSNEYCNARFDYKGLRFCDEKGGTPHWHVAPTSGGGGSGNTGNPRLFTFPHINIQGYVVPNTGEVYSGAQLTSKLEAPAMRALESKIRTVATREGIDFKLFYSLIAQESAGNPQATSPKGACGVTQLKPSSASEVDPTLTGDICTKLKNDVDLSISLGAKYFKKYGSTPKDKLAHYNGGNQALESSVDCPGRKKYECPWDAPGYYDRNNPSGPPLKTLEKQSDINVGFSETRFYVINILNMAAAMRTQ